MGFIPIFSYWLVRQILGSGHLDLREKDCFKLSTGFWGYSGTFFITVTSIIICIGKVLVAGDLQRRKGQKKSEHNRGNKVRERRRCSTAEQVSTLSPLRTPHWSQWIFPDENRDPWRAHARAGEKYEEEEAAERNCSGLTIALHAPCTTRGG